MTYWVLAYTLWACPGGWFGGKAIQPGSVLQALSCRPDPRAEVFDSLANAKRRQADTGGTLSQYKGLRRLNGD